MGLSTQLIQIDSNFIGDTGRKTRAQAFGNLSIQADSNAHRETNSSGNTRNICYLR